MSTVKKSISHTNTLQTSDETDVCEIVKKKETDEILSVNSCELQIENVSKTENQSATGMANNNEILVKNMQTSDPVDTNPVSIIESSQCINSSLNNSLCTSKTKLSRNNSSTFSSKSHYSVRSSALVKTSANESLNDSIVNPLSIKRIVNLNQQASGLNSIDYTGVTSTNPQGRPSTFDTVSATSTSNRSIYSFNRIANVNNSNTRNTSISGVEDLSNVIEVRDPVIIRGAGNITIFGVSNKFNEAFPSQLYAKLAPEEFRDTIKQINNILSRELANSFRWLVFGSVFCCCTLGCSLFPVIFINKKARLSINKFLSIENQRLYLKLGLKWKLAKIKCNSNSLMEYVLLIEFLPTVLLYHPD